MSDDLLPYYNAELAYLREQGAEFAARFPKVAARLQLEAGKCADPHVERLLEGVAFLTARVRRKIDDEFPEITDALLGVLYPHYQRPLPSMTVVQFVPGTPQAAPPGGSNRGRLLLRSHSRSRLTEALINARSRDGSTCDEGRPPGPWSISRSRIETTSLWWAAGRAMGEAPGPRASCGRGAEKDRRPAWPSVPLA